MVDKSSKSDAEFLQRQRAKLEKLRDQLQRSRLALSAEQQSANETINNEAREYEDDAQKLATLELADNVIAVSEARLSNVERALRKMDQGTYGLSEQSGVPISRERLEASPEALYTLAEQEAIDR